MATSKRSYAWIWTVAASVIAFGAGFVTNYYVAYRGNYLTALNANYEQFDASAAEVKTTLKVFGDISQGVRQKSPEDTEKLQQQLLTALTKAEDLSRRVRSADRPIKDFGDAAVHLQSASEEVTGPADAKKLVEAVDAYLVAEQNVRTVVLKEYNAFLW